MFRRLSFEALNRLTMGDRATELFTSLHGQVGGTCDNEKGLGRKEELAVNWKLKTIPLNERTGNKIRYSLATD